MADHVTQVKMLEIRDAGTFIPLLAVDMNVYDVWQRYLLRRCGYACDREPNILITRLSANGSPATNDPYHWPANPRTFRVAHDWIIRHWAELQNGSVVDVEFILGETATPKQSECCD